MKMNLGQIAQLINCPCEVHADLEITAVAGIDSLIPGALTFAENAPAVDKAVSLGAGAVLVKQGLDCSLPHLVCAEPRVDFARLLAIYYPRQKLPQGIHQRALVSPQAQVDAQASLGAFAVVEAGAVVEANAELWPHAILRSGSHLGKGSVLLPGVQVGNHTTIGDASLIGPGSIVGDNCRIGDDVEIGARCQIANDCQIGPGARIDNMARLQTAASVGPLAIVIAQTCIGSASHLGQLSIVASQAMINDQVTIGDGARIAGRAYAASDIPQGMANYGGDPAQSQRQYLQQQAQVAALAKLRSKLNRLWARLHRPASAD